MYRNTVRKGAEEAVLHACSQWRALVVVCRRCVRQVQLPRSHSLHAQGECADGRVEQQLRDGLHACIVRGAEFAFMRYCICP